jgi:hypothetical protein
MLFLIAAMIVVPEPQKGSISGDFRSHPDIRTKAAATTSFKGASPADCRYPL